MHKFFVGDDGNRPENPFNNPIGSNSSRLYRYLEWRNEGKGLSKDFFAQFTPIQYAFFLKALDKC